MGLIIGESHYHNHHVIVEKMGADASADRYQVKEVIFHSFSSKDKALEWCRLNKVHRLETFDDNPKRSE